jgi:peptidoglycan/LPS O-acetylase OafA/YrhL
MVLISHIVHQPGVSLGWLHGTIGDTIIRLLGRFGVFLFFVLSGYLITTLLCNEKEQSKRVDLRRFWIRRAFRIFPVFYAYLSVIAVITAISILNLNPLAIIFAGTYTLNYSFILSNQPLGTDYPVVGHFWTLSVEEQFYLMFPLVISVLTTKAAFNATLTLIVITPATTVITYLAVPGSQHFTSIMGHNMFGVSIALGCLCVLAERCGKFKKFRKGLANPFSASAGFFYGILIYPVISRVFGGYGSTFGGEFLLGLSSLAVIIYAVECSTNSWFSKTLNHPWIVWFGRLSYSIYVWHQLPLHFKIPFIAPLVSNILLGIGSIGLAAFSYYFLEQPILRLRDHLQSRNASGEF